jgi:hypothetical protein
MRRRLRERAARTAHRLLPAPLFPARAYPAGPRSVAVLWTPL